MTKNRSNPPGTLVPSLIYRDIGAAIEWLCAAFGFEERLRAGPDGPPTHAQLLVGAGAAISLGTARTGQSPTWDDNAELAPPRQDFVSMTLTVRVDDVDAHYARAVEAGARILNPPTDYPFGERQYTAVDLEGHRWNFSQSITDVAPESWGATVGVIDPPSPQAAPVSAWELADLSTPWAVYVAVTLRLAEHIRDGVTDIADLATATGADEYMLHRLLTHLASRGVFEEPEPRRFELNAAAEALLDPGARLGLDLDGLGGRFAHAWSGLLDLVRTGQPGYEARFGLPFWDDLHAYPELAADFDALMGPEGHGVPSADIPLADGWDGVGTIVDVGGGTGTLLAEILKARPEVRGTLVDLPATVERSKATFEAADVADRATAVGQSFFDALPAGADIYLLRGVINDWPDPEALALLRRCAEAARPSGLVIVIGGVRPDGEARGLSNEMVLLGGKNRNVSEFRVLAREAGLEVTAAEHQHARGLVVECRPV